MKNSLAILLSIALGISVSSCNDSVQKQAATESSTPAVSESKGQSGVQDDLSQRNVVQIAIASKDHSTLVTAVQAADLVNVLSNAGPFTVFAPTNAAFAQLPAGTVEGLLKPEKKEALTDILQYHVSVGVFKTENMTDGQVIGQVNGDNITISKKDGKILVNGTASIVATVPASNGIVYVIDKVLTPPAKK
ncbi:MAG: fasciclin domain-containing protein [Chitinophagaceae bacterium]|nr:fasciclin domain-containing protein [Chitinophagaceae bacterium]